MNFNVHYCAWRGYYYIKPEQSLAYQGVQQWTMTCIIIDISLFVHQHIPHPCTLNRETITAQDNLTCPFHGPENRAVKWLWHSQSHWTWTDFSSKIAHQEAVEPWGRDILDLSSWDIWDLRRWHVTLAGCLCLDVYDLAGSKVSVNVRHAKILLLCFVLGVG